MSARDAFLVQSPSDPNFLYQGMVYWPHIQRRPMKEALDQKPAGTAVHPSSPDVRKPSHAFNRWFIPVGAVAVHICIGSVYAWSTFNRPIQSLFPNEPWWFSPPYTTFTTALVLLGLSARCVWRTEPPRLVGK